MATAHKVGFRTTATIMYGHVEQPRHWARHLVRVRDLQQKTGGFTEFVPLPFVHMEAPLYLKGRARRGPTFREAILMHAVARLALHPHIANIQASWVKMGHAGVVAALNAGCNDLGGTLMNESITRAAGAGHGQETSPRRMIAMIEAAGRIPRQRTTTYADAPPPAVRRGLAAGGLARIVNTPARKYERRRTRELVKNGSGRWTFGSVSIHIVPDGTTRRSPRSIGLPKSLPAALRPGVAAAASFAVRGPFRPYHQWDNEIKVNGEGASSPGRQRERFRPWREGNISAMRRNLSSIRYSLTRRVQAGVLTSRWWTCVDRTLLYGDRFGAPVAC